ncbi:hypothetical protein D3C87_1437790 [compost metagenome]
MPYITGTEIPIYHFRRGRDINIRQSTLDTSKDLIQCCAVSNGDIVNIVFCFRTRTGSQNIGLDRILYKAEIATRFPITINENLLVVDHGRSPLGNNCCIGAIWILTLAEHVEVTKTNGFETVGAGKDLSVQLIYIFRDGIRRKRLSDNPLDFRQSRVIAIGRAGGCVSKTLDLRVFRRDQHIQKAINIGAVRGNGIIDGTRDGPKRRLMQNVVHRNISGRIKSHRPSAVFNISDIPGHQHKSRPLLRAHYRLHLVEITLMPGRKVIEPNNPLIQLQQRLQ